MSLLRKYMSDKKYHYRVKTVIELDDDAISRIERAIAKYVPLDIGQVEKTIFQRNPLDFPGIENREVYIVDITLEYPASSYILQQELRFALNIPEKFIVVRGENEPTEVENQRLNAEADMTEEAEAKGLTRDAMLNNSDYPEGKDVDGKDYYGDEYNSRLTGYLAKVAAERKAKAEVVAPNAPKPFKWLEQEPKQDSADFNANVKGAAPSASNRKAGKAGDETAAADAGHLDDNTKTHKRIYKSASGSRSILSKTGVAVKKD